MKLPSDALIAEEKITQYLLKRQARGDKSAFLARAGYTEDAAAQLIRDLRDQVLPNDATPLQSNEFGQYYEIWAALRGPKGRSLAVRTIWIKEHLSGATKFVTLIPQKKENE